MASQALAAKYRDKVKIALVKNFICVTIALVAATWTGMVL
jgi:hypothetical protein